MCNGHNMVPTIVMKIARAADSFCSCRLCHRALFLFEGCRLVLLFLLLLLFLERLGCCCSYCMAIGSDYCCGDSYSSCYHCLRCSVAVVVAALDVVAHILLVIVLISLSIVVICS